VKWAWIGFRQAFGGSFGKSSESFTATTSEDDDWTKARLAEGLSREEIATLPF
jgi:hypothetical protein